MGNKKEFLKTFEKFQKLNLKDTINYKKFNLMLISHHSSAIEGSSLTEVESQLLLDEGLTPSGKPILHVNMETDHNARLFIIEHAK